jgi:SAM-dependent methyltransferase
VHRECRNQRGHAIAILDDHAADASVPPDIPVAIISPGFGQTATDYSSFSYYLARHHLRVLRYDHTNHVGLSEGELQNLSLRGLQTDLAKVVEFVRHTWPTARVVVLASDLAARAAMKTAVDHHIDLLVLVNPVVDVGAQLADVHGHDLISDYRFGLRRGVGNLFGLNVNIDQFVADVVAGRFPDLASTLEDARLLRSPLCLVTSPAPESISLAPADLPHAFMTAIDTRTRVLSIPFPLTTQDLPAQEDHPASFRQVLDQIASALQYTLPARRPDSYFRKDLMRQRRLESEHLRLRHDISQIGREALALAHGQQLQQLANVHEYRKLLDDLYAFLSPLDPGMTVLEAGIGQSDVARALLVNHAYRTRQRGYSSPRTPLLIGMRRSPERIRQARRSVLGLQHELVAGAGGGISGVPWLRFGWVQGDWTEEVPIPVRSIDRIVSNLSLSFVASPQQTLREWARILHPNGRLVFTTFHPSTGLSVLYRHHLRLANHDEFETHAQQVLHYLGRLREAICHGILHTFDPASLASLLRQTGHPIFRIRTILDGQALVAIVGNSNSSGPG